ncbi:MAG: glycine zipper 2TM domain-containing protein [Lysobacter sp.]|nr:glycine zipper 2TM domain-containing protein [Lysobacter sp.]
MNLRLIGIAAITSIAMAGCATTSSPGYGSGYGTAPPSSSSANCYDCGTVTRIEMTSTGTSTVPNATGAVLGGIVGAAAGRELADDESKGRRNTATVAGAVAGAVAGNAIQNSAQRNNGGSYNVHVRMNDGRTTVVSQSDINGIREGSSVRVYNGRAWAR